MNPLCHRLVFSRRLGMLVAVAETASAQGKAAGSTTRRRRAGAPAGAALPGLVLGAVAWAAATLAAPVLAQTTRAPVVFASKLAAPKFNVPQPYGTTKAADGSKVNATPRTFVYDPAKGSGSADLSTTGAVTWSVDGKTATFDQGSQARVVINWDSFDIGAGYKVQFKQDKDPARYVSALNRIWSADPSVILGSLSANREVILLNANGVYFGRGAVVDTGKFVATANAIADSVFEKDLRNITDGSAAFSTAGTDYQATNLDAAISVETGAEIRSAAGGDVLLVAPRVANQGRIVTPQGQAVLAAGDKVYLMSSSDPAQRGLIVAVDPVLAADGKADPTLGTVENAAQGSTTATDSTGALVNRINEIRAESGTVNLVGLTVRQSGQINATTAVKGANGAIWLQAMSSTAALASDAASPRGVSVEAGSTVRLADQLGTVDIAAGSGTAVKPSSSTATQIDAEVFNASRIRVEGAAISVGAGAQVLAPAGRIEMLASSAAGNASGTNPLFDGGEGTGQADSSRIVIAPGAVISTAGVQNVEVDGARNQGAQRLFRIELADAALQRSTDLYRSQVYFDLRDAAKVTVANVSGAAASVARTAAEKSTAGGSIRLLSDGALVLADGATLDVSGGSVHYGAASIQSTVLSQDGRDITFAKALGSSRVDGVSSTTLVTTAPAYTEGANGGSLTLSARQMALAGTLAGSTTVGERQRDGRSTAATAARLTLGLNSGNSYYLDRLALRSGYAPALDISLWADALGADLGTLANLKNGLDFSLDGFAASGFGTLNLRAAAITQPEYGQIALGKGGAFSAVAGTVQLDGGIHAPGGTISISTAPLGSDADATGDGDIRLSGRSRLDVAGLWTNDTAGATTDTASDYSIQVKGGMVTVQSGHSLQIDAGAVIDASAGARLSGSGTLTQGTAGSITLGSGRDVTQHAAFQIDGAVLRAYGFAGGGTLRLNTPALTFGGSADDGALHLPATLLASGGFGSISINALGDIRVASGTTLAPQLLNWQFATDYRNTAGGGMDTVATPVLLDERLAARQPVNLTLSATRPMLRSGTDGELSDAGGSVTIERGASIVLEPGATLALNATHSITVGATGGADGQTSLLQARGGTLSLAITGERGGSSSNDGLGFVPDQALWLGSGARLVVDGITQLRPDTSSTAAAVQFGADPTLATPIDQRRVGTVLGGGSIALTAARGYVVAEEGARLSLDGAQAAVSYAGLSAAVPVAKAAGSLTIASPEGIVFEAGVSAQAPRDATGHALADGGQLSVALGRGGVSAADPAIPSPYPGDARVLSVGLYEGVLAASGATPGSDLSATLGNGLGRVRQALLQSAGWSGLTLAAGDQLRFDSTLAMNLPLGVQLDAPAIAAAPGVQVAFSGGAARLGDSAVSRAVALAYPDAQDDSAADGSTALSLSAPTIDVYGNLSLQGFSTVSLNATQDIRLSAATPTFDRLESLQRQLNFGGTLALSAQQVYATTATQYTLNGLDGSRLVVRRADAAAHLPAAPLSAFGSLTVNATNIAQGGVLRQPFGRITLNATDTLRLGENSLTSVSGSAATLLYGQTLNLSSWQVPGSSDAFFYLADSKALSLNAARFDTAATATVSAAGGGTVLAREFFPGVGGSTDYYNTPGLYAVLPDYAGTQSLSLDGGFSGLASSYGQQIVITQAGSGLAPGRYTLLPAQYALLGSALKGGAFLVSLAADQGKTVLRAPLGQDDGSVVVTGYLSSSGASSVGTPGQRFVVEPAATYLAKSEVRLTDVSTLLNTIANTNGTAVPALPRDGGQVTLTATDATQGPAWRAALALQADGGRAGTLDVSAAAVALVDNLAKAPEGALTLSAATLEASGAGSVLLGGTRRDISVALKAIAAAGGTPTDEDKACSPVCLDTRALTTTVDLGRQALALEELLLTARQDLSLAAGTTLTAKSSGTLGARTLVSQGDGALLAVSANALSLPREATMLDGGNLSVGAGSRLSGTVVSLDATGRNNLAADTVLTAGTLNLAARHLVLGTAAQPENQDAPDLSTVLNDALLAMLAGSGNLALRAYAGIDFAGTQNWSLRGADGTATRIQQSLVLDAPVLRGVAGSDGQATVSIAAHSVVLRNSSGKTLDDAKVAEVLATGVTPSTSSLLLEAAPPLRYGQTGGITIGPGSQALGFDQSSLRSTGDIVLQGSGGLNAQGSLLLGAARLTAATGANQAIAAAGALTVASETGSRSLGERVGQGANVSLSGATLAQDGVIDLPGGLLTLAATGGSADAATLRFGAASRTSVAGYSLQADNGQVTDGTAGRISASAQTGRIELLGTLDASAALRSDGSRGEGDAGRISLQAAGDGGALVLSATRADGSTVTGQLLAQAGRSSADLGGQLLVDLRQMASADVLASAAMQGGLTGAWQLRVREGDVTLDTSVTAQRIALAADGGSLSVGGTQGGQASVVLDARAPSGGVLQLAAGGDLVLGDGVSLSAGATRADASSAALTGGDVLLASDLGRVRVANGAVVDTTDAAGTGGRIVLRARRGDDNASVAVDALNTANLRGAEVDIEAVRVYENVYSIGTGIDRGDTLGQTAIRLDNAAFMAGAASIGQALGLTSADAGRVQLRAGVEVRSDGDLSIDSAWNLASDRPGGDAGFLTLRAAGNLLVNASISDGFASTARTAALNGNTRSWSLRLAAGADLAAALPTTVQAHTGADDETATLSLAAGTVVRTGAGSLELAAGRDLQFQTSDEAGAAQAYVAGRRLNAAEAPDSSLFASMSDKPLFTTGGGRLEMTAGRDVTAPEATQLIGNWFWRGGTMAVGDTGLYTASSQLAWWTQFDRSGQTLGAFGGGNLLVQAGRDLLNVQAMAPSVGWADSRTASAATLQVRGGGTLTVDAGRDLLGGQFLIGGGVARLNAGGTLGANGDNVNITEPVLAMTDGQWRLAGRSGIVANAPYHVTATPASADSNRAGASGYYYTWGADAGLSAVSNAGAITLLPGPGETPAETLGLTASGIVSTFTVTVPSLRLLAAGGDLTLSTALMYPSAIGQLNLWAGGSLVLRDGQLVMSDSRPADFPSIARPVAGNDNTLVSTLIRGTVEDTLALTGLHVGDTTPAQLHADQAVEIRGIAPNITTLMLPKPVQISAGTDITELSLRAQNLNASDTTSITAGRNLQALQLGRITVAGPGSVVVSAGGNVDLGSSAGITTTGNLNNASLPSGGASVSLSAATTGTLDLATLQASYLSDASADGSSGSARAAVYRQALLDHVRSALQQPTLNYDQAWALFQAFPATAQAAFGRQLLASEFSATYLNGSVPTAAQMTASLRTAFERDRAQLLAAARGALASGTILVMPGVAGTADVATAFAALPASAREGLSSDNLVVATDARYQAALQRYIAGISSLSFDSLDLVKAVETRVASLAGVQTGWKASAAALAGGTVAELDALVASGSSNAQAQAYRQALADTGSARFTAWRDQVLAAEIASVGAVSSAFGAAQMPIRNAFYEQGFQVAELAGVGTAVSQAAWQTAAPLLGYSGTLNMTQSAVVTQRGGDIRLVNPGGAINVGLKEASTAAEKANAKGVIALGGGSIFGLARDDFQVNTQRVFIVGQGDMAIWSSTGDIDSGRGANTAVAAPPLTARRSVDGVVFETPATTTGSGLGILEDASGKRSGSIGLYPAFGEILALDAFIRAPSVVLGSTVKGADNLQSASVSGAAAAVAAPALSVSAPASTATETRQADAAAASGGEQRPRNALLTVDLLGLGPADGEAAPPAPEACSDEQRRAGRCAAPGAATTAASPGPAAPAPGEKADSKPCAPADRAAGRCK